MTPAVLHLVRPYASEAEFLAAEAWTVDARSMLLVDEEPLEPGTLVMFDVLLESGERLIRAEGRVAGFVAPTAEHPGGVRVRFKRYGSQTKAFVERAVAYREAQLLEAASVAPVRTRVVSAAPPMNSLPPEPILVESVFAPPAPAAEALASTPEASPVREPRSGTHLRPVPDIGAPPNRDELLSRLRARLAKRAEPEPVPASHRAS